MPTYEYECAGCSKVFEASNRIETRSHFPCPTCGIPADKIISQVAVRPEKHNWSNENNGKGRYITQLQQTLGSRIDESAYCTSRQDAIDKARRRGHEVQTSL